MLPLIIYWRGVMRQAYGKVDGKQLGPSPIEWAAFKRRMARKSKFAAV